MAKFANDCHYVNMQYRCVMDNVDMLLASIVKKKQCSDLVWLQNYQAKRAKGSKILSVFTSLLWPTLKCILQLTMASFTQKLSHVTRLLSRATLSTTIPQSCSTCLSTKPTSLLTPKPASIYCAAVRFSSNYDPYPNLEPPPSPYRQRTMDRIGYKLRIYQGGEWYISNCICIHSLIHVYYRVPTGLLDLNSLTFQDISRSFSLTSRHESSKYRIKIRA